MDIIKDILVAAIVAGVSTLIAIKVVIAELKRDMEYAKSEIQDLKNEKRNDISELKAMIKDANDEKKDKMEKLENRIEQIFEAITQIKVDIASKK